MHSNLNCAILFVCLSVLANSLAQAGKPYVDRFSASVGSAQSSIGQSGIGQSHVSSPSGCKGNCPTSSHAKLQLWAPDDANVTINGQSTKHQALGGVHKFSRIYNLNGLNALGTTECVIQVDRFDMHGNTVRMQRVIWVMAGESYSIRFPEEFVEVMVPQMPIQDVMPAPIVNESYSSVSPQKQANDPAESKPSLAPSSPEAVPAQANSGPLPNKTGPVPDPNPSLDREMGVRKVPIKD